MPPLTEREKYRVVLKGFAKELAAPYRDPLTARRSFAAEVYARGAAEGVRTLASRPEEYGRLRVLARPERAAEAARWGEFYARSQESRTRPVARVLADLYRAETRVYAADERERDAQAAAHDTVGARASLTEPAAQGG